MTMTREDAANGLHAVARFVASLAPAAPGYGSAAVLGAAAAIGLVADLIALGEDPVTAITEIREALPEFDKATQRVNQRIADRFKKEP